MKVTIQSFLDFKKKNVPEDVFEYELLKHFLDINLNDKLSLAINSYKAKDLVSLFSKDTHELITTFKHRGIEYGFIPNISEDLTLGEYIDLNSYADNVDDTIKWLSVLYRPIVHNKINVYTIEEYKGKVYPFEDLDVTVLLGAQYYFFYLAKAYQRSMEHSLKEGQMMIMN